MASSILVCSQDERIHAVLPGAEIVDRAVAVLERDDHDVVVLDAHSDPDAVGYLRGLTGARRRDLFVALVLEHDGLPTGDRDFAWRESVDLVVHVSDLGRLDALLRDGARDKSRFYERFRAIARAQGES